MSEKTRTDAERRLSIAIVRKCFECVGEEEARVTKCEIKDCPLHPYRLGGIRRPKGLQDGF